MSEVQSEEESSKIASKRRDLLKVASEACRTYLPVTGSVSFVIFTTHITNPRILHSVFPGSDLLVSNALLLTSHAGLGTYLYSRRHMQLVPQPWRVIYSVSGAALFNLGSIMFCAMTKVILPRIDALRTFFGIASGVVFLNVVGRYLQFVDDNTSKNAD